MEKKKKGYNRTIDLLRLMAIAAVVLIHSTTKVFELTGNDLGRTTLSLWFNQTARFAVPLFFMISGFSLELNYNAHGNYLSYLKKRVERIFVPYIVWSLIYYYFIYQQHHETPLASALIYGSASNQLYFIPTLLIFYIIFPLLHRWYEVIANKWIVLAVGIIEIALLYTDYFGKPIQIFYPLYIAGLNFFVFLIGIIASRQENLNEILKRWRYVTIPGAIIMAGYVFWEGRSRYFATGNYLAFYSQWRISVMLYTLVLGASLYYLLGKTKFRPWWIKKMASLSFFVFFVHMIVLEQVWRLIGRPSFNNQIWFDGLIFGMTAGISYVIAYGVHKIPGAKTITS